MNEQQLRLRLEALGAGPTRADWREALDRAAKLRRRRNRLTIAVALAAAVIVAAPTLAVSGVIDFGTAPKDYQGVFEGFGVEAEETRVVLRPKINGREHMLMVAPRRTGGYCYGLIERGRGGALTCADAGEPVTGGRGGVGGGGGDAFFGTVGAREAASVELVYKNRPSIRARVVWVSEPIDAGFFAVGVPRCPHVRGVVVRDADGRELARQRRPWSRCWR